VGEHVGGGFCLGLADPAMLVVLARGEIPVRDGVRGLVQQHDQAGCGFEAGSLAMSLRS
jgi:hypothetical protein